jgi:hypothetical protein
VWIVREFWALSAEPAIWQRALRRLTVLEMAGGGAPILVPAFTAEQHGQVELESRAGRLAIRPWLGREIAVTPGVVNGSVDVVSASGGGLSVKGWAADTDRRLVADWVLVFSGDRLLAAAVAAGERPDLERAYDERVRFAGYTATARTRRPGRLAARARLRVFAVLGERASELTVGEGARAALARLASG